MAGHLGADVAALLDGQLSREATAVAWEHVADCEACSDAVARQIWVKSQLRRLASPGAAPAGLKASLVAHAGDVPTYPMVKQAVPTDSWRAMVITGVCFLGAAALAVFALSQAEEHAPDRDPRIPTVIWGPSESAGE